jgi:hypothetical protein
VGAALAVDLPRRWPPPPKLIQGDKIPYRPVSPPFFPLLSRPLFLFPARAPERACHSRRPSPPVGASPCPADHAVVTAVPSSTCWPKESSRSASKRRRCRRSLRRPPRPPPSIAPPPARLRPSRPCRRAPGEQPRHPPPPSCPRSLAPPPVWPAGEP